MKLCRPKILFKSFYVDNFHRYLYAFVYTYTHNSCINMNIEYVACPLCISGNGNFMRHMQKVIKD